MINPDRSKQWNDAYDEFMERWASEYSDGDSCHDDACEYADVKEKDPSKDVEDYGNPVDEEE